METLQEPGPTAQDEAHAVAKLIGSLRGLLAELEQAIAEGHEVVATGILLSAIEGARQALNDYDRIGDLRRALSGYDRRPE